MKKTFFLVALGFISLMTYAQNKKIDFEYKDLTGIGPEKGVMRRDPSDIIKVGDLYYVWYTKGSISSGYDGTVWYATSKDGYNWEEKGMALAKGKEGTWEGASVFTPNILVANNKYYLFYTGTSRPYSKKPFNPDSKIGLAISSSPNGPWKRIKDNPVITNSSNKDDFDSHLIDDACLVIREGKYWLYYKGRQLGKSPAQTKMGVAIADKPEGPYIKYEGNPVIKGNHEVAIFPHGKGVGAMIGTTGPKDLVKTIQYAEDGIHFKKISSITSSPVAAGLYRPEAFTESGKGNMFEWGVRLNSRKGYLPFIQRFNVVATTK